jgi:SAM-dependent methyltransferase
VFDDRNRRDTTGVYCRRALQAEHEVQHFLPDQMDQIRPGEHDLFMNIDDGRTYSFRADLHPSIFWAIDTHIKPERCLEKARDFDLVFCAQREGKEEMHRAGIPARWCPLAFDPEIHRKYPLPKILDISFVGNFGRFRYKRFFWTGKKIFRKRARLISLLKKKFNLFTGNFYFEDMAVVNSISKVVFNRSVKDDVNMRVFEALGCGSLLLTNRIGPGQDLLFKDREHLVEYKTRKELAAAAKYYLRHDQERERVAEQGRTLALRKHTYAHRMDYMLSFLAPRTEKKFDFSEVGPAGGDYRRFERAALAQFCEGLEKGTEVGCGPRKIMSSAIGIDILKGNSGGDLLSSEDRLPFRDGELDYVVASHNLEHYADVQRTLREWKRVLKIGGILGVVVPDDRIIDTLSLNPEHRQAFSPDLLGEEMNRCGGLKIEVLQEVVDAWSLGCICRKIS